MSKSIILLLFIFLVTNSYVPAQCPTETDIRMTSVDDIEQFVSNYPDCKSIDTLAIANQEIINLNFINQFDTISLLSITGTSIQDFDFLSSIESIDRLILFDNDSVKGEVTIPYKGIMDRLDYVDTVSHTSLINIECKYFRKIDITTSEQPTQIRFSDSLRIVDNLSLEGYSYVSSPQSIEIIKGLSVGKNPYYSSFEIMQQNFDFSDVGSLSIFDMNIFSFDGSSDINSVSNFAISDLDNLLYDSEDIPSFSCFITIIKGVKDGLYDMTAFSGVKSNTLFVNQNESLTSLNHLNLSELRSISINGNLNLTDISGLNEHDGTDLFSVKIDNNVMLSNCAVYKVCDFLGGDFLPSQASITNNDINCNSIEEVLNACINPNDLGTISLTILIRPNPVQSATYVTFYLNQAKELSIRMVDIFGRSTSVNMPWQQYAAGEHTIELNLAALQNGSYIILVSDASGIIAREMVVKN